MLTTFSGRRASQDEFELTSLIKYFNDADVVSYLEIGARHGDTFHEIMLSLPVGSYGMAVDLPGGLWGKGDTHKSLYRAADDLRARGYKIDVILGDSTSEDVIKQIFEKAPFDACLIDGNHLYDGVKADWINYQSAASIIAFHDIVGDGQAERRYNNPVQVPILWAEISNDDRYASRCSSFVATGSKMGIGVCDLR